MTPAELLERTQWDTFWVPRDATVTVRPDLLMIECPRPVATLNAVLRTRAQPPAVPALVREVSERYGPRRGRWIVTDTFDRAPLVAALRAHGWIPGIRHEGRVLPVHAWRRRSSTMTVRPVDSRAALLDCIAVTELAFDRPYRWTEELLAEELEQCRSGARVHRFVAYSSGGTPVASGGLTAFPALGFGMLWGGGTVPDARGHGAYSAVLSARITRALELGLHAVGLYAREHTSAPIVARFGFAHHGEMQFWDHANG